MTGIIIVLILTVALMHEVVLPHRSKLASVDRIRRFTAAHKLLVLTYDDGPDSIITQQLLDLMHEYKVHATFFSLWSRACKNPELLDQIQADEHEIGSHSEHHLNAWKTMPWKSTHDLQQGHAQLKQWLSPSNLFRPPYGKLLAPGARTMQKYKATPCWWTIDSGDTEKTLGDPAQVVQRVRSEHGGVVLMHDFDRSHRDDAEQRRNYVLHMTRDLIELARKEDLTICTYGELLDRMKQNIKR
ncbi:MAG: polysaccharide deacetylase family protein [Phycisphaeraceae bacterium]|nr:polysaccharide deacetylase family protein [Phycisphaerales bacterium]MCB9860999.1 polysaccharide deacetylase family protein [Phycisphaeraceae bacterium]